MNRNQNRGFISSPTAFIRQIRNNLEEGRYARDASGFTIFKELLQNADDAGATGASFVHFGISDGFPQAEHPLLRSPALYVINDGPFEPQDEQNILRFGENSKSLDSGKIGKFGLGLKSLFYLGEAFFYFFFAGTAGKAIAQPGFLNPWSSGRDGDLHREWDELSNNDLKMLFGSLKPLFMKRQCFSIWIPLRQQVQLNGKHPIAKYFPGDNRPGWMHDSTLPSSLQSILPLLKNVKTVRGFEGAGETAQEKFCLRISDTSRRRYAINEMCVGQIHTFSGNVDAGGNNLCYCASEVLANDPNLLALHKSEFWPDDEGLDPKTGEPLQVKEKAEQHGACCVSIAKRSSLENGKLTIGWSVFLPLGKQVTAELDHPFDVVINIHGYFFTDAGRNGPIGLSNGFTKPIEKVDDQSIKAHWNYRLASTVALPLLPETLAEALSHSELSLPKDLPDAVTRAIADSSFFQLAKNAICKNYCWTSSRVNSGEITWNLHPSNQKMLLLPGSTGQGDLAWEVFPTLAKLSETFVISFFDSPRLCHSSFDTEWPTEIVSELIQGVEPESIVGEPSRLHYMLRYLEFQSGRSSQSLDPKAITQLTRRLLQTSGMERLSTAKTEYQRLVRSVPQTSRVAIDLSEEHGELLQILLADELNIVIVPKAVEPEDSPCLGHIETDDCESLLLKLANAQGASEGEKPRESISRIAAILLSLSQAKSEVIAKCGDVPVFHALNCRKRKNSGLLTSWNELNRKRLEQTLFVSPPQLAYRLQDALLDEQLFLIHPEVFGLLFPGVESRPVCSPTQVVETLSRHQPPKLAALELRKPLLDTMLDFQGGRELTKYRKSVRYLLHGSECNFDSEADLLASDSDDSDLWRRIVLRSLEVRQEDWRLLDMTLADALSRERRAEFSVRVIDSNSAIGLIASTDPAYFDNLRPSPAEYAELLDAIDGDELCKSLPIHQASDSRYVAITENCFWQSELQIAPELAGNLLILRLSNNADTRHRQLQLTRQLDEIAVLQIAVKHDEPHKHARLILDALAANADIPENLKSQLANTRWLMMSNGNFVSPCDVIRLPKLHDEVRKIVASYPGSFFEPSGISQNVLQHPAYNQIEKHLFADTETSLAIVGELLKARPANAIGKLDASSIENLIEIVGLIPESVLPASEFIAAAKEKYPQDVQVLVRELASQPIGRERILTLLDAIRNQHSIMSTSGRREQLLTAFNAYLAMLVEADGSLQCIRGQRLLSKTGHWTEADYLVYESDGISADYIVHSSIDFILGARQAHADETVDGKILPDEGMDIDWGNIDDSLKRTGSQLKKYFRAWESSIPNELIGGFLALLGDDDAVQELAQQYLGGNRTLDQTRRKFGLFLKDKHDNVIEDGPAMIAKQRCIVEIASSPKVSVLNIFGSPIEVDRNQSPSSVFVGYGRRNNPFPHRMINNNRHRAICFRLNQIDISKYNPADLADLLRDSAVKFILEAYALRESQIRFAEVWEDLSRSDQLDISIAQARVIDNAFLILEQYGLKNDQRLGPVIRAWDAANKLVAEQSSGAALPESGGRDANREREDAKTKLRDLLENDVQAQLRVASAVRQRIEKHYQYTIHSIPFEIFQNADDASIQLRKHFDEPERIEGARVFRVFRSEETIVFVHFGRCINQYPRDRPELRSKFDDDLWSMLVLNLSSKSSDEDAEERPLVTGKYGLGFKSSYLVADSPGVISGRLGFQVRGAMYPKRIIESEAAVTTALSTLRDQLGESKRIATLIELPIDRSTTEEVLSRFESLAGYLVVFARHISTIVINDEREVAWLPQEVKDVVGCLVGTIDLGVDDEERQTTRAMLLRNEYGSLLLRLDSEGFSYFDVEVPTIWVTAPTEERLGTGFIVNGGFNVDVGRAQLSRDLAENEFIASNLGRKLGQQLEALHSITVDEISWKRLISEFRLAEDATPYAFFDSLFDVLCTAGSSHSQEPGPKLLHDIVWRDDTSCGSVLVSRLAAMPTRLAGEHQVLTSSDSVRFLLTGMLDARPELLEHVSKWSSFLANASIGSVVSRKRVVTSLPAGNSRFFSGAKLLRLKDVIEWEIGESKYCVPTLASSLGKAISSQTLLESDEWDERQDLEAVLRQIKVRGRDGKFHSVTKLLCPDLLSLSSDFQLDSAEEQFRSQFAPNSYLLSEDYDNSGIAFFDACRGRMEATSRLMADWILKARDLPRQKASLQYLAHGQLRRQVIAELQILGLAKTWLEHLVSSTAFSELDDNDRRHLWELIPAEDRPPMDWSSYMHTASRPRKPSPEDALVTALSWWRDTRNQAQDDFGGRSYLDEFVWRTYPYGALSQLDGDGVEQRRDWVVLLLLGLFHTQGRSQPEQHRGFLQRCESEGWLKLFSSPNRDPSQWMGFIENYLDQQVDDAAYWHWMRHFVGIFQLNRHLDDYIESFLAIDRIGEEFSLLKVLNTRSSHLFQGGGLDTPPLSRLLGLGSCFVVRELVRAGILKSEFAHQHCFVPTGNVRRMFAALGCDGLDQDHHRWDVSTTIHDFVAEQLGHAHASFCGDFDIPFQFIAEDPSLQQDLFHDSLELEAVDDDSGDDDDQDFLVY